MPTIQQILQDHFDELAASGTLSAPQQRAGWALRKCRTAALGGHVQRCPNGHIERVWYNSCRNRACPQCNGLARERWLQRTQARLIDCAHWHVIFTIPHQLNMLWQLNTAVMMDTLFAAARDTLLELLNDPRHLGAQAGHPARAAHLEPGTGSAPAPACTGQRRGHARGRVGEHRGAATSCRPRW